MQQRDSRRLRGANLLLDRPAAILEVDLAGGESGADLIAAWQREARRMLAALGWQREQLAARHFPRGAMLAISAPLDALTAATEVNEWAFAAACERLAGAPERALEPAAGELAAKVASERNPRLLALHAAAHAHGLPFFWDDKLATLGHGGGSASFALNALPEPESVDWKALARVPVAIVTGTNGKSTTVRLLWAIARAAGLVPGLSSTDWVRVGDQILDTGDYSGPVGARLLLRDARTQIAILETARGGIMRRGLALEEVDVALITNVAADHLGEFGNADLAALCDAKFVVTQIARAVVLNADCAALHAHAERVRAPITWFSRDERHPLVQRALAEGRSAAVVSAGALWLLRAGARERVAALASIPVAMGGAARHNVENALGALAVAHHLGIATEHIARGLADFRSTPQDNPGRLNAFELGGVHCLVDFAHNTHGFEALFDMARALAPARWAVLVGQAGDRDDASIREMSAATWAARPDRIIVKEMLKYLRGRAPGEVPAMIAAELARCGAPAERIEHQPSEIEAVRSALAWARPGDLLLLLCHADRERTIELLQRLQQQGWKPGDAVPEMVPYEALH